MTNKETVLSDLFYESRIKPKFTKDSDTKCWKWIGATSRDYPVIVYKNGQYLVHRLMWQKRNGLLLRGTQVYHTCDNRSCINPLHMTLIRF